MRFPHRHPPDTRAGISRTISGFALPPARAGALAALTLALGVTSAATAQAHDAPSGWKYPWSCCSGHDCRPVTAKTISEIPNGYVIATTGEIVPFSDSRVQSSPDGEYHWCSVAGADDGKTICLFVPQRMF